MRTNDPVQFFAGTPQILWHILENIGVNDLKNCLQVSKGWQDWAIKLLSRKKVVAVVRITCQDIEALNDVITKAGYVSGLRVKVPYQHGCQFDKTAEDARLRYERLLVKRWHYLDFFACPCVPLQRFMNDALTASCETVEELKINYMRRAGEIHSRALIKGNMDLLFPKLRAITIGPEFEATVHDLLKLIPQAPNLQHIGGLITLDDVALLDRKCYPLLTEVHCMATRALNNTFQNLVAAQPKLHHLQMYDTDEDIVPAVWSRKLGDLLCESTVALKRLSICAIELLKLVLGGGLEFNNLAELELFLPENATTKNSASALGALNFPLKFPSLLSLRLKFGENCYHPIPRKPVAKTGAYIEAKSVQSVMLEDPPCNADAIRTCAKSFPHLQSFGFELLACVELCQTRGERHKYEISAIWKELPLLERVSICMKGDDVGPDDFTLDELFCGLSSEECDRLRMEFRAGNLRISNLQLCPLNPSMSYASRLRDVCLVFAPSYSSCKSCVSEVAIHLAFALVPSVALKVRCYNRRDSEELDCLLPRAEISYLTGERDWW